MKKLFIVIVFSTQLVAQNQKTPLKNVYPHQEFTNNGYLINDSISFIYDSNKKAVIVGLRKKSEIKNPEDSIVKRLFFLYKVEGKTLKLIFKNNNLLPDLTYGQRSNVGYEKIKVKNNSFSYKIMILPFGSNKEFDLKYSFSYNNKKWVLLNCEVNTFYPFEDKKPKFRIFSSKDFGNIEAGKFNVYDFNPFALIK